jgi:hypothetical protein
MNDCNSLAACFSGVVALLWTTIAAGEESFPGITIVPPGPHADAKTAMIAASLIPSHLIAN